MILRSFGYLISLYFLAVAGVSGYLFYLSLFGAPYPRLFVAFLTGSSFAMSVLYVILFTAGGRDARYALLHLRRARWERSRAAGIDAVIVGPPPHHMTAVFDRHGNQIPAYQGEWRAVRERIREHYVGQIEFIGPPPLSELEEL